MMPKIPRRTTSADFSRFAPRRGQRGVVLLISLIMLITLSLGGLALFRQIATGVMIAGNLTFKNASLSASDLGSEAARDWLSAQSGSTLEQASLANGYYPGWCNTLINGANKPDANTDGIEDDCKSSTFSFDPLTYNWNNSFNVTASFDGNGDSVPDNDADGDGLGDNGYTTYYVIHRLCRIPGSLNVTNAQAVAQECVTIGASSSGSSRGSGGYGQANLSNSITAYYRVTIRTTGPRNTVAYSQAIMY